MANRAEDSHPSLPKLISDSERIGEAPVLTCSLEGTPQTLSLTRRHNDYDAIRYTLKFTYQRRDLSSHTEWRPITFFLPNLIDKSTWAILRNYPDGLKMVKQDGFESPPFVDGTRLLPLADHQNDFITLYPGESWSDRIPLDDDELFEPFKLGDTYTFQFIGAVVQWWNWGTFQDLAGTSIRDDETSHNERPKIIIPASRSFDFVVIT